MWKENGRSELCLQTKIVAAIALGHSETMNDNDLTALLTQNCQHERKAAWTVGPAPNHAQPTWRVWRPEDQEPGFGRSVSNTVYLFFTLTTNLLGWLCNVYAWYWRKLYSVSLPGCLRNTKVCYKLLGLGHKASFDLCSIIKSYECANLLPFSDDSTETWFYLFRFWWGKTLSFE